MRLGISFRIPVQSYQRRRYPKRPIYPDYRQNHATATKNIMEHDKIYPIEPKEDKIGKFMVLMLGMTLIASVFLIIGVIIMAVYR